MKYKILVNESSGDLSEAVNKYIQDGWEPIGGISVLQYNWETESDLECEFLCYQSIIKRTEKGDYTCER